MVRPAPLVILLVAALSASAQVYRWVDKDGKVHYSDKAPKDVVAKDLGIDSKPTDPAAAEQTLEALRTQNAGLEQAEAERNKAAAAKARDADLQVRRCAEARSQLAVYERVSRVVSVDGSGKESYDSDAQLDARRAEARRKVAELCG